MCQTIDTPQTSRLPYETPCLTSFGTLAELTQGGGASQSEGGKPIPGKKP
ncbi:lasso RiPP family leader peptide-containing protein [Thermomonas sp.]